MKLQRKRKPPRKKTNTSHCRPATRRERLEKQLILPGKALLRQRNTENNSDLSGLEKHRFVHHLAYLWIKCISLPFSARSKRILSVTAIISSTECSVSPENDWRTETSCPCSTFQRPLTESLYPRLSALNFTNRLMVPSAR